MRARAYRICQESTDLGFEKSTIVCVLNMPPGAQQLCCATNFTSLNAITNRYIEFAYLYL